MKVGKSDKDIRRAMIDFNSEEDVRRLLKSACEPVVTSPELKERLFERLRLEADRAALSASHPVWRRPKLWVPIAAVIISAVIGYGVWLSLSIVPTLSP